MTRTSFHSFVALSLPTYPVAGYSTQIGAGSSLYLRCALRRSLDELAQSLVLTSPTAPGFSEFEREEQLLLERVEAHRDLGRIICLSADQLKKFLPILECKSSAMDQPRISVSNQIKLLLCSMGRDHAVLVRWSDIGPSLFSCQVFVPTFERAFLLKKGKYVAPAQHYKQKLERAVANAVA